MAAGLGAQVYVLDIDLERLRYLSDVMPSNVVTVMSNPQTIRELIKRADVVTSSVLVHGGKTPTLISREMLKTMKRGAVIVDIAVDQGGSFESSRPTTHEDPIYKVNGVIHYCVSNMPGAMPMTSTMALTNATLPYAVEIADKGFKRAILENREIRSGANIVLGKVTYKNVADAFGMAWITADHLLGAGETNQ